MSTLWPILGVVACPLGMFAMGGVAWAAGKLGRGERPSRVARTANMLACNPISALSRRRDGEAVDVEDLGDAARAELAS